MAVIRFANVVIICSPLSSGGWGEVLQLRNISGASQHNSVWLNNSSEDNHFLDMFSNLSFFSYLFISKQVGGVAFNSAAITIAGSFYV